MQLWKSHKKIFLLIFLILIFIFFFDKKILLYIKDFQRNYQAFHSFLEVLDIGMKFFYFAIFVATAIFTIYGLIVKKDFGKPLALGMLLTGIFIQIKHILGRARPSTSIDGFFNGPSFGYAYSSFPSGHTTFAFMVATVLSNFYPRYRIIFYILAGWVGFERVEDFAHFPSDVIAGAVLGIIIGKLVLLKIYSKQKQDNI
ncbi:phosphatase PAP2 family protein [Thermodesulfovibrio yellowstonii]|nr:phosphatase PAP2 family protein [Thermodesulfovibrio islandicus]